MLRMPDRDSYAPADISTGEVYRLFNSLKVDLRDVRSDIKAKPSAEEIAGLKERIADLESWQTWAMRLGIPGLIGVVLNLMNTINGGI